MSTAATPAPSTEASAAPPLPRDERRWTTVDTLCLLLALAATTIRYYHTPFEASALNLVPDAVEYAVGAHRIATVGEFNLAWNGQTYPSRYAPWMSLLLAPAYLIAPDELGAGVYVMLGFCLLTSASAYLAGKALAGTAGGCAAAGALLLHDGLAVFGGYMMTDLPSTALGLSAVAWLIWRRAGGTPRFGDYVLVGVFVAVAYGLRQTALAFVLPPLLLAWTGPKGRARAIAIAALVLPVIAIQLATWGYQYRTFGDPFRNGYQYWCPVPYDYPGLTFSGAYVAGNASMLLHTDTLVPAVVGVVGMMGLLWRRPSGWGFAIFAAVAVVVPTTVFYQFYFFPSVRFYLTLIEFGLAFGAAGVAAMLPPRLRSSTAVAQIVLVTCAGWGIAARSTYDIEPPFRRMTAEQLAQVVPDDGLIVTEIHAPYLEPMVLRGTRRRVLPISRGTEYASKLAAPRYLGPLDPPPSGPTDHRAAGLLRAGGIDVFPATALDAVDDLVAQVNAGRPVFLVLSASPDCALLVEALRPRVAIVRTPAVPEIAVLRPRQ
jgi:hypothetical protein